MTDFHDHTAGADLLDATPLAELGGLLPASMVALAQFRFRRSDRQRRELYRAIADHITKGHQLPEIFVSIYRIETDDETIRPDEARLPFGLGISPIVILIPYWLYCVSQEGDSLEVALRASLPLREASMLAVFARNGLSKEALLRLASEVTRSAHLRAAGRRALMPLQMTFLMIVGFAQYASHSLFPQVFRGLENSPLGPVLTPLRLKAEFIANYSPFLAVGFFGMMLFFRWLMPNFTGTWRRYLDDIPLIFSLHKRKEEGLLVSGIAILLQAKCSPREALEVMGTWASPYLQERLDAALRFDDMQLGDAFMAAGMNFPNKRLIRRMRHHLIGQKPEEALIELADEYAVEIDNYISRMIGVTTWFGYGAMMWFSLKLYGLASSITTDATESFRGNRR